MLCTKCGKENEGNATVCANCGETLSGLSVPKDSRKGGLETYNTFAETVGGVPSLRLKDNLYQGIFVGVITIISAIAGYVITGSGSNAVLYGAIGFIGAVIISGVVIGVLGLVRAGKKIKIVSFSSPE